MIYAIIFAVLLVIFAIALSVFWASRYVKVSPNQIFIISGRKRLLPDGSSVGFRTVKAGGTFVWPVLEKVDALSMEVLPIEISKSKVRTAQGALVEIDATAQIKIKSDDDSIVAAAEHFLSKSDDATQTCIRLILEKYLCESLEVMTTEEINNYLGAAAAKVQGAAAGYLSKMGLGIVSFTIRHVYA